MSVLTWFRDKLFGKKYAEAKTEAPVEQVTESTVKPARKRAPAKNTTKKATTRKKKN